MTFRVGISRPVHLLILSRRGNIPPARADKGDVPPPILVSPATRGHHARESSLWPVPPPAPHPGRRSRHGPISRHIRRRRGSRGGGYRAPCAGAGGKGGC